jgi:hypothetical protein
MVNGCLISRSGYKTSSNIFLDRKRINPDISLVRDSKIIEKIYMKHSSRMTLYKSNV